MAMADNTAAAGALAELVYGSAPLGATGVDTLPYALKDGAYGAGEAPVGTTVKVVLTPAIVAVTPEPSVDDWELAGSVGIYAPEAVAVSIGVVATARVVLLLSAYAMVLTVDDTMTTERVTVVVVVEITEAGGT